MAANINGLIYYKLDAENHGYTGDITKNCGLRGEEIDGNFNFLRGYDIKSINFDEKNNLYLTRLNGEILVARPKEMEEDVTPEYNFSYDPETGELKIVTPSGEEIIVDGFNVSPEVYHDATMDGAGQQINPLGLSNIARTGTYRPASTLIDMTKKDEYGIPYNSLPSENLAKHDRHVTKEKISIFGKLYPLWGMKALQAHLESINSEWRVPTKEDWDKMLNAVDCSQPDHGSTMSNVTLGEIAGNDLKSTKYWYYTNQDGAYINPANAKDTDYLLSEDHYGFSVLPAGYADSRGFEYTGGFGKWAAFWTNTEEDKAHDMYVKLFDANKKGVVQHTWGSDCYLSIRLVKDFTGSNYNDAEDIDGTTVNCMHFVGQPLIWTKENIALTNEAYGGVESNEWKAYVPDEERDGDVKYFVNDWNGKYWDKYELKEGESIVIFNSPNGDGIMHEWRLVNGELMDTGRLLKDELQPEFDAIYDKIQSTKAELVQKIEDGDNIVRQEFKAADDIVREEFKAADNIVREEFKAADDIVREEFYEADNIVREEMYEIAKTLQKEFQEADDVVREEFKAADDIVRQEFKAADDVVRQEFKAADDIVREEFKGADEIIRQEYQQADNIVREEFKVADNAVREEFKMADNALRQEFMIADNALRQEFMIADNVVREEFKIADNVVREEFAKADQEVLATVREEDAKLQRQIDENKVNPADASVIVTPGTTDEEGNTVGTTIKVNLPVDGHIRLDENGLYFDGNFGTF